MARKSTDLVVNILGDYDSLKKTLRKASGDVDKFDKNLKQAGKSTGLRNIGKAALGAAAGLGAVTIAANEIKKSVTGTVELAKATRQLQRATGLASEDASRLASVLKVRGLSTDKVGRSFTTLARQIEAAKTGTGSAAEAFTKLGVSQKAIQSGNFNQVLLGIADGFGKLGDGTAKASTAQQLFGRNSRDLLPLLEGGSQKLREQLALAPALSDAQVKQSLAMVNAQRQVDLALMNVRTTLGTTLMPVLADGANKLAKFVTEMKTGKGEGGEFAKKVRDIYNAAKPAIEQLVRFAKAVFNFAAENPGVVRIAASLAAVGVAIKGIKFLSAISGLSSFLKASKALGGPLRKLFQRFGTQAGTAFASEATGTMAGNMAGSLAPGGPIGKMGGKSGRFAKWGRIAGRAAGVAFAAAMVFVLVEEVKALLKSNLINPQDISKNQDLRPGTKKFEEAQRFGQGPRRRSNPSARGSSAVGFARGMGGIRGAQGRSGGLSGYGGDVEASLLFAQARSDRAQSRVDSFQRSIGSRTSRSEAAELRKLKNLATEARREVDKLQKQVGRRQALTEITQQFKEFAQGFADAYAQGLERIQQARLSAAQKVSQKILDDQLRNLDEEEGQSEEARRIRELRAQQERDTKEREDKDYGETKKALEEQLARAITNGNLAKQRELNQSIEDLDTQRRDTLRNREIGDLSESLQRQRRAAQDEYEARVTAAQDYYDAQVVLNNQLVENYRASVQAQMEDLQRQLESGRLSYVDYNTRINELNTALTTRLNTELETRATNERISMASQLGAYGNYVNNINAEFSRVMSTLPAPVIPPIPRITVDVFFNYLNPPTNVQVSQPAPSQPSGPARADDKTVGDALKKLVTKKGATLSIANIARDYGRSEKEIRDILAMEPFKSLVKKNKIKFRASGGSLSRSTLTMVGETGPELIMGGQVYSGTRTARMSGSGVTLNVYPQTTADDPVALARALGWQLATR